MSSKKSKATAEAVETMAATDEITQEVTEEVTEAVEEATEEAESTEAVAYIGPSIKFVATHGTVYNNGLPRDLAKKVEEIPMIKGLLIPISKLAVSYVQLATEGSALNNLYNAVAEKLK
ncbi:MAG: hypothetical protein LUC16_01610 [Coprobacillus sp.]|nr:hypothetical protein [Coprobacillus sp.]